MNALIVLISMLFVVFIIFKIERFGKIRYILAPFIAMLYGALLFYVGMSISGVLFYILAVVPLGFEIYRIMKKMN